MIAAGNTAEDEFRFAGDHAFALFGTAGIPDSTAEVLDIEPRGITLSSRKVKSIT